MPMGSITFVQLSPQRGQHSIKRTSLSYLHGTGLAFSIIVFTSMTCPTLRELHWDLEPHCVLNHQYVLHIHFVLDGQYAFDIKVVFDLHCVLDLDNDLNLNNDLGF